MRRAWKVRLAGLPPLCRVAAGTLARTSSTSRADVVNGCDGALADDRRGDPPGEPLLAVLAQDAGQVLDGVGVEHLGGGQVLAGVHPHVQRRVDPVGEAAVVLVELQGRDAEVEQDRGDRAEPEPLEDLADLVVHRVHQVHPVAERGEPLARPARAPRGRGRCRPGRRPGWPSAAPRACPPIPSVPSTTHRAGLAQRRREQRHDPRRA